MRYLKKFKAKLQKLKMGTETPSEPLVTLANIQSLLKNFQTSSKTKGGDFISPSPKAEKPVQLVTQQSKEIKNPPN